MNKKYLALFLGLFVALLGALGLAFIVLSKDDTIEYKGSFITDENFDPLGIVLFEVNNVEDLEKREVKITNIDRKFHTEFQILKSKDKYYLLVYGESSMFQKISIQIDVAKDKTKSKSFSPKFDSEPSKVLALSTDSIDSDFIIYPEKSNLTITGFGEIIIAGNKFEENKSYLVDYKTPYTGAVTPDYDFQFMNIIESEDIGDLYYGTITPEEGGGIVFDYEIKESDLKDYKINTYLKVAFDNKIREIKIGSIDLSEITKASDLKKNSIKDFLEVELLTPKESTLNIDGDFVLKFKLTNNSDYPLIDIIIDAEIENKTATDEIDTSKRFYPYRDQRTIDLIKPNTSIELEFTPEFAEQIFETDTYKILFYIYDSPFSEQAEKMIEKEINFKSESFIKALEAKEIKEETISNEKKIENGGYSVTAPANTTVYTDNTGCTKITFNNTNAGIAIFETEKMADCYSQISIPRTCANGSAFENTSENYYLGRSLDNFITVNYKTCGLIENYIAESSQLFRDYWTDSSGKKYSFGFFVKKGEDAHYLALTANSLDIEKIIDSVEIR